MLARLRSGRRGRGASTTWASCWKPLGVVIAGCGPGGRSHDDQRNVLLPRPAHLRHAAQPHPAGVVRTFPSPAHLGAAAATGQEPYSVALMIADDFPRPEPAGARDRPQPPGAGPGGVSEFTQLEVNRGLPARSLVRHFTQSGRTWRIDEKLRRQVRFQYLNLAGPWPQLPAQDLILLRNVLIYFDEATRQRLRPRGPATAPRRLPGARKFGSAARRIGTRRAGDAGAYPVLSGGVRSRDAGVRRGTRPNSADDLVDHVRPELALEPGPPQNPAAFVTGFVIFEGPSRERSCCGARRVWLRLSPTSCSTPRARRPATICVTRSGRSPTCSPATSSPCSRTPPGSDCRWWRWAATTTCGRGHRIVGDVGYRHAEEQVRVTLVQQSTREITHERRECRGEGAGGR